LTKDIKLDILAIAAHPDDIELSCAGTILKHIDKGYNAGILDLTKGELGTRGSASIRMNESAESAGILGLTYRQNLGMSDGFIEYSKSNLNLIITEIRRTKPEIVLLNAPRDRHPDHGNASKLERDACFYAGLANWKLKNNLSHWRPKSIYFYIQDYALEPDFVIDVSSFVEKKFNSILAFKSQFFAKDMEGPQTPISGKDFIDYLKSRMRTWGRSINVDYAEGFLVDRTIGVDSLFDLK
jgi:bacillithiol biosynthesis deacetylase BshB1